MQVLPSREQMQRYEGLDKTAILREIHSLKILAAHEARVPRVGLNF